MAITDIDWGTVTLTNGSTTVTGSGTSWIADDIRDGDTFVFVDGGDGFQQPIVASVQSNTELTLRNEWEGPTLTATAYTLRYQWDSSRVSAMSRRLIMLLDNGNLEALAALTGPGVAVFNGPHSMEVRPFTDFVNGVRFDVQVDTLADRDTYDGQVEGFTVLVSDMGDGRSAVFTKNSNTIADWSDAAYITGPVGPLPDVEATVSMLPPGSTATVTPTPITSGVRLDFELPGAEGFYWFSAYDPDEEYAKDSVVRHNRSAFIATQSVPVGEGPSNAFPPVDNAYWDVLAAGGANGEGTVSSVEQGLGITVDDTDPTAPIVSLDAALGDLKDVDLTTNPPEDGQTVVWDETEEKWVPGAGGGNTADLEFTIAQLVIGQADVLNVAQFLGPNGNRFADSFDALTYVDVAGATNLDTTVAGLLKSTISADTYAQSAAPSLTLDYTGFANYGTRTVIPASALTTSGDRVRLTLTPPVSGSGNISAVYIGHKAAGGSGADFTGDQVQVTFNGSNTVVLTSAGGAVVSDIINYNLDDTEDMVVSISLSGAASSLRSGAGLSGYVILEKASANAEAGNTAVSGYSTVSGRAYAVSKVEVRTASGVPNNLTVRSSAFSAASAPTRMKALINVKEIDAAVAGTDYTMECSRDNGTTWTSVALTERYTLPTTGLRVVEGAETSVSDQPSGIAPRWRFKTLNNKNVELHDVYLYWS